LGTTMRFIKLVPALLWLAFSPLAWAQAQLPEGKYRGGNDLVGHGCTLGANSCQVGLVADFYKNSQGQPAVDLYGEVGTATYLALKDGNPYPNETNMRKTATMAVVPAADGTFSFRYGVFIYDQCRYPGPGVLQCYFHKTEGDSRNWITLYKR
jgi:hypothetical protein